MMSFNKRGQNTHNIRKPWRAECGDSNLSAGTGWVCAPSVSAAGGIYMRMDGRVLCKHLIRKKKRKWMVSSISGTLLCLT